MLKKTKKLSLPLIRIGLAVIIAALISQFNFDFIESYTYDLRVRFKPTSEVSGNVVTIAIDRRTIESLKGVPGAEGHKQLVERLSQDGAKAIIYLVHPHEIVGSYEELKEFAIIAGGHPGFYVAIDDVAPKGEVDAFKLTPPFENLQVAAAPTTSDSKLFAKDEVTRRMFVSYQDQPTLHPVVAKLFNPEIENEENIRGIFSFLDSKQVFIDFRKAGTYRPYSFFDVIRGTTSAGAFKDKIVIVGRDIGSTSKDYIKTPFSRDIVAMTTLEMQANMIDTMILNSAPVQTFEWLDLLITSLISILTVYVVLAIKPTRGLVILGSAIVIFFMFCYVAFWSGGVWIEMAHPILSIFICYYFFIPYRLIMENRKSWEYLQKNRLLTQVEELKTNFISMMSHDLKTPLARIQGMTDIVLNDPTPLSDRQKEALLTLRKSSQELLDFISSILNLGRIESKEIRLHLQSKDINTLLDEIIKKFDFTARQKGITIITEFEPLFSVKMDVDLIRQVFSNLIENAIKYSPENTRVLVSTEEKEGYLVVQVADQGAGIPEDELGNVFMKFYRSKNAKASTIKGSGLGLYLAKYFVELHKGRISVDSSVNQGSTFTVELPMDAVPEKLDGTQG